MSTIVRRKRRRPTRREHIARVVQADPNAATDLTLLAALRANETFSAIERTIVREVDRSEDHISLCDSSARATNTPSAYEALRLARSQHEAWTTLHHVVRGGLRVGKTGA